MFKGKKLLLIVVDAECSDEQLAQALSELAAKNMIAPQTTPVLLTDSDFTLTSGNRSFGIARYKVRETFQRAIEALKKVCGSPKSPEFYRNALRAYADGHIETPVEDVLTTITADERAWLEHVDYRYALRFIDNLPNIRF